MTPAIQDALVLSGVGVAIVFTVLTIIALVIRLLGVLDARWMAREAEEKAQATQQPPTIDDLTVVLIAAAVTTMFRGRGRITRLRRLTPGESAASAWSVQGRMSIQGSHSIDRQRGQS